MPMSLEKSPEKIFMEMGGRESERDGWERDRNEMVASYRNVWPTAFWE